MASTARNMLKTLHDRKCGAVVMLSDFIENGKVRHIYHKAGLYIWRGVIVCGTLCIHHWLW